ncbi:MAG: LAGLIDADG family homing endonuclease, partial [Prochlorotrichaceae cyanobacterium]
MDGKVLMWNGVWKPGSEIEVGDRIMNPDGQPQEVLQVHDRGVLPFYRVTFEDETFVDCDRDHLWGFWESRSNSRQKSCSGVKPILDTENPASWNTNYIVRARVRDTEWLYQEVSKGRRFIIPICAPLNFTQLHRGNKERAYFYGAILGDGSIGKKSNPTRLHCPDQHVINRCLSVSEKYSIYEEDSNCPTVAFRDDWVKQWVHNSGLTGKTAHEKFIPSGYLSESLEFRWNLAQGLFDTDGYAAKDKNEVSYTSVSPQLANDVANLVRSLGFLAKIFAHRGVCYTKGYEGEKRMAYTVQVQGNRKWRLFSLPRKVEQAKANESMHWVGKAIVTIEKFPDTYSRCITVSNPNGLYITDGFNVTHNSDLIIGLALSQHKRSLFIRKHWTDLSAILSRIRDLTGAQGSAQIRLDDRLIELGGCKDANSKQKYRGRPHDLKAFDELSELRQEDYEFISAWNRTAEPGQRCRIVATTNPPDTN